MRGFYFSVPFTTISMFVEWREQAFRPSYVHTAPGDHDFIVGRLNFVLSLKSDEQCATR